MSTGKETGNNLTGDMIDNDIVESHRALSGASERFLQYVRENPQVADRSNYNTLHWYDDRLRLQPWPVFRNQKARRQFEEASLGICKLVKQLHRRLFSNDPRKISRYYDIPEDIIALQLEATNDEHIDTLLTRGDFILSQQGLKCIEFNVSSDLGGMEKPIWEAMYLQTPVIDRFIKQNRLSIKNENLLAFLLKYVTGIYMEKEKEKEKETSQINIALAIPDYRGDGDRSREQAYLQQIYKTHVPQDGDMDGQIVFCDYHHLKTDSNGVFFNNIKIHILIEIYGGIVTPKIIEQFKKGNIHIYNGPITRVLSNKLNLVLLSENQDGDLFSPEEREIIKKYIPWTRKIAGGETHYNGKSIDLREFVISHRERLVLKPSGGYGGIGVAIGKKTAESEWKQLVQQAFNQKGWLVQEYFESLHYLCQTGTQGFCPHHIIWGEYVFGDQYLGGWVRFLPVDDGKGVINRKQGAEEGVIFDVEE